MDTAISSVPVLPITNLRRHLIVPTARLLVVLLLILLSGLPQIGIFLTGIDVGGERIRSAPLTRSLLLDKLLPEAPTLNPPESSEFPPLAVVPAPAPLALPGTVASAGEEIKPSLWLLHLAVSLYRHHSSYV